MDKEYVVHIFNGILSSVQFSRSVVSASLRPHVAARQASLSITNFQSSPKLMSIELVMPSSHLILCHSLLLLPPIPPSIRVFSNELTLCMSCSAIKKNEIMPFSATWMDLEIIVLDEVRQRKTSTIWYHLYVESKIWHKWTYLQNINIQTYKTTYGYQRVVWRRDGVGAWV